MNSVLPEGAPDNALHNGAGRGVEMSTAMRQVPSASRCQMLASQDARLMPPAAPGPLAAGGIWTVTVHRA